MKNLLYKEFKLTISPFFYILPILTGALMLIPSWLYFFVLLYCCFIAMPNIFGNSKSQNDINFSILLPVRKKDIVKARIISIVAIELLHLLFAVVFAIVNSEIYSQPFFFLSPNIAFFGLALIMYAIVNVVFFPIYFKTAYKYGAPTIISTVAAFVFAATVELLALFNSSVKMYLQGSDIQQLGILFISVIVFILLTLIAYKISTKKFEMVDV
jgi:hypothetical protein